MKLSLSSTQRTQLGRRLGLALSLSAVAMAALVVIPANPAAASQLGNQITVSNTDVVSAGVGGMRGGSGSSSITLSGASSNITKALLYWHGPTNSTDPAANASVTFAGTPITGTNIGFSHDNCWGFTNSQGYRADVTSLVTGNGTYTLSNFVKTGVDINGVSLIVFFDDGNPANNKTVTLIDGNDSNVTSTYDSNGWDATLSNVTYTTGAATLELHVADGQSTYADDALTVNSTQIAAAGAIFQGDSVPPNQANGLWDIKDFDITSVMSPGANTIHLTSGINEDCLSLVVAEVIVQSAADLSITKSDSAPYGPDPVSSGQPVAYGITVTNNGPDNATGITVTDTPQTTGATVQSGFGTNWTCDAIVNNTLTCHYSPTLNAGDTSAPLTAVVKAPTNSSNSDTTMTDQASVTGGQFDPNNENDTASQDTTVTGSGESGAKDKATGFFDGTNTLTIATTRDTQGRFYSSLTIPGNSGLTPGVVSIDETQAYPTLCGGKACDAQVQLSVVPAGTTPDNNAIQVHLFYVKDTKQGSTIYVQGDLETSGTALLNCMVRGIANPPKCVNSRSILRNGDRDIMLLWTNGGDPWTGKK